MVISDLRKFILYATVLFGGLLLASYLIGCANLERDRSPTETDASVPDSPAESTPDASVSYPDASVPDACVPECSCDNDCGYGERCDDGRCYEKCWCDDDCSGPGNQSCDHGLCKGH